MGRLCMCAAQTSLVLVLVLFATFSLSSAERPRPSYIRDCEGGACPFDYQNTNNDSCGLWLGPSHIKKQFNHGFGLGMFSGRSIEKGTAIEPLYNGANGKAGEPLIPFYGSERLYETHPPLREVIWDEENFPEVAVEFPAGLTAIFVPGLAAIVPCTQTDFNLAVLGPGKEDGKRHSVVSALGVDNNGAHAVRHNVTYVAVRDIQPGEELTIECSDDDFNGGAYYLTQYDTTDEEMVCLDNNLRVDKSPIQGNGLFAKRTLYTNTTVLSSPLLPIHRSELDIDDIDSNDRQLMLNYCYGHPDSDLLWLPFGPMISYINHSPQPNARLQWKNTKHSSAKSHARQQQHHPELFTQSGDKVTKTHGKTLTIDIVPLRDILPDEEITIDYGTTWVNAWNKHAKSIHVKSMIVPNPKYMSAEHFMAKYGDLPYQTLVETIHNPYPDNLETFCFYPLPDLQPEVSRDHLHNHQHVLYYDWTVEEIHECFRPCEILERSPNNTYTVQLREADDPRVIDDCVLDDHDELWTNVPAHSIRMMDRPFSTPVFSKDAFRMEIGLPDDMVPEAWKRKRLRGNDGYSVDWEDGAEFKRRKTMEIKAKGTVTRQN